MKYFYILFLAFQLIQNNLYASHAMGADLTYVCTGNNTYELTYTLYRDCAGIPAPYSIGIDYTSSCFPTNQPIFLDTIAGNPTQISTLCPTALSTCNGGTNAGIEKWVYKGQILLPGPCADWQISHSESARNAAITTITGAGADILFVFAIINNTNTICNNSPVFSNPPVNTLCDGQTYDLNPGAFDPDGDSLTYEIITPRTGPMQSDTVFYLQGYSATQPLISNPPMSFDSATGNVHFRPIQQDVSVFAIMVSEYRNGVLIGKVERDIQLTVTACNNFLPALAGINGHPIHNFTVCVNQQNCFYIRSVDVDQSQTTFISWDNSIQGMNFTQSMGHRDTAFFCWTPGYADTISNPHCFTVTVMDDNCPYLGINTSTFCMTVVDSAGCIPLSVGDKAGNTQFSIAIYPQPASNYLNIDVEDNYEKNIDEVIFKNMLGEIILRHSINGRVNKIELAPDFKSGLYIATFLDKTDDVIANKRFIVEH